ncbi:MAG: hypothetical protein JST21_08750 [Bacteroidetes bacterium]|nr:hypothetical protein [Bacteroidota bacterium]
MFKLLSVMRCCLFIVALMFFNSSVRAQLTYNELSVQYDSPWTYKKLQLIPIRFKGSGAGAVSDDKKMFDGNLISFEDALRQHKVVVKELTNGGADVSTLLVKNKSNENVMLMSGEMVQGGKQDRAFGETTIIPRRKKKNYIPVFCVEKGRWDDKAKTFRHAGTADAKVRKQIDVTRRQSKLWKVIDTTLIEKNKKNQTDAYLKAFETPDPEDSSYLRFFIEKMRNSDSAYAGFIGITGNRIISAEIFAGTDLCVTAYIENIKSYVRSLQSTDGVPVKTHDEIKTFTDKFLRDKTTQKKYLSANGRIYYYEGQVIHLVAYDQ